LSLSIVDVDVDSRCRSRDKALGPQSSHLNQLFFRHQLVNCKPASGTRRLLQASVQRRSEWVVHSSSRNDLRFNKASHSIFVLLFSTALPCTYTKFKLSRTHLVICLSFWSSQLSCLYLVKTETSPLVLPTRQECG
jgi:hypothetical protein